MGGAADSDELRIYEVVFGHPRDECPPNYYHLLGIQREEKDVEKIKAAAGERMAQLRLRITADQVRAGRSILKRIQRAQICLLDPQARAAYDATLNHGPLVASKCSAAAGLPELRREIPDFEAAANITVKNPTRAPNTSAHRQSPPPARSAVANLTSVASINRQGKLPKRSNKPTLFYTGVGIVAILCVITAVSLSQFGSKKDETLAPIAAQQRVSSRPSETSGRKESPSVPQDSGRVAADTASVDRPEDTVIPTRSATSEDIANHSAPSHTNSFRLSSGDLKGRLPSFRSKQLPAVEKDAVKRNSISIDALRRNPSVQSLDKLPIAADLPEIRSVSNGLTNNGTSDQLVVDLGSVPSHGMEIGIDQPKVMAHEGVKFSLVVDPSHEYVPAWLVRLSSEGDDSAKEQSVLDDVGRGFDENVARLYVKEGILRFAWMGTEHLQMADQLRNCVVTVQFNGQRHRLQLRKCQSIAPAILDFESNSLVFDVGGAALPAPEAVFLHLENVQCRGVKATIEPPGGKISCQKNLKVTLLDGEQTLEIQIALRSSDDQYKVIVVPRFRLDSRWRVFSSANVNEALRGLETALNRQQNSLKSWRKKADSLPSQIASASSGLSSGDLKERMAAHNEVRKLKGRLVTANRSIERGERSIKRIADTEASLQRFVDFGNKLRGATELDFRVGVATENGDLNLLRTSRQVAQLETQHNRD